jgi:glycosyltransferase involved in cell wall biosynthesis
VNAHPTICLNMIVKNEAHIIGECLDSVAPYISSWVIVDTGSDDGTQEVIRTHMAQLGISGELHERPFRDFGYNRSEALALARGRADYLWVIDADDIVVGTPDFRNLSTDLYWLRYRGGAELYWSPQILRDGMGWSYVGVVHEAVASDRPYTDARLEGDYHIEYRCLGDRGRDPQKRHERDRDLLLADLEGNPDNGHAISQLARAYFLMNDFTNARRWYERRIAVGGNDQDVYVAMFQVAESMAKLGSPWPQVQDAYLTAWEFRQIRAEPLYAIARKYLEDQRYALGYQFARLAADIPFPAQETIVRSDVYTWRADDDTAACAYFIGKHREAFSLWRGLLARLGLPDGERPRIAANRDACAPAMIEAAAVYPEAVVRSLVTRPGNAGVVVSLVAGPDRLTAEHTLNSFLTCCTDISRAGRFLVIDAGLSAADRAILQRRYAFLEFAQPAPGSPLAQARAQIDARAWVHLGSGWRFFAPEDLLTRLSAVLDAEPQVFQVGVNVTDATQLTRACAAEQVVRRAPDAGRYVLTDMVAGGPAMFDTARLDLIGGIDDVRAIDPDPLAELGRRAAAAGLRTASLDEVLCIATPPVPAPPVH